MLFDLHIDRPPAATLADFTEPRLIQPWLRKTDAAGAIQELSELLRRAGVIRDLLPFYHAALNREFLFSTAVAPGLALPHARSTEVEHLVFALGRCESPIRWSDPTGSEVRIIGLAAVPATDSTAYLHWIAGLARALREADLFTKLLAADTPTAALAALATVPIKRPGTVG